MRTIFKTKLDVCECQTVELPQDYKIIHVAMQQDTPCIWYECTPDMPLVKEEILCYGTGFRMPDPGTPDGAIEHIGSVITSDGFYVWHFYRKYWPMAKKNQKTTKEVFREKDFDLTITGVMFRKNGQCEECCMNFILADSEGECSVCFDRESYQYIYDQLLLLNGKESIYPLEATVIYDVENGIYYFKSEI